MKAIVYYISLFLVVFGRSLFAQDLLVTYEGDSVNCKINKETKDKLYFTFKHKDEIRSVFMPKTHVVYSEKGFFDNSEVPTAQLVVKEDYTKWRLELDAGLMYRLGKTPDGTGSAMAEYYRDYKSGYGYNLGLQYFVSESLGFGVLYNHYNSFTETSNYPFYDENFNLINISMSESVNIDFVGPIYYTRLFPKTKQASFISGLGLGYLGYYNQARFGTVNMDMKGGTFGLYCSLGYDMKLTKALDLGLRLGITAGSLSRMTYVYQNYTETMDLGEEEAESLTHFDLTVGLRINK